MKKIVLILCLLLLVSCGKNNIVVPANNDSAQPSVNENTQTETPVTPENPEISAPEEPTNPEISDPAPEPGNENPVVEEPVSTRSPEQESLDTELIMLLREQLAGAYTVKGATFTYVYNKELDGKDYFAYEMINGEVKEIFAVATDSTAIYHLEEDGTFKSIFNVN